MGRLAAVAARWGRAPSSYLSGLTGLEAFWVDEAAAVLLHREGPPEEGGPDFDPLP